MKIANIVTNNKVDVTDDINVVKDLKDIIVGIPTLVTSYKWVSENYDEYDIYDKELKTDLFWTFAKTERRDIFSVDVENFITYSNKRLVKNIKYIFIDLIHYRPREIRRIIRKILSTEYKVAFKHKHMIYIYTDNYIFGLDLELINYMGFNLKRIENKIKNICDVFLENDEIFIEYKDNMERLEYSVKYIPYLYTIKNG